MLKLTPKEALQVVLDNVDYKARNCSPTDMVGAVLSTKVIKLARKSLEKPAKSPRKKRGLLNDGVTSKEWYKLWNMAVNMKCVMEGGRTQKIRADAAAHYSDRLVRMERVIRKRKP